MHHGLAIACEFGLSLSGVQVGCTKDIPKLRAGEAHGERWKGERKRDGGEREPAGGGVRRRKRAREREREREIYIYICLPVRN